MNKYQESLNNLKSIDLDLVLNSTDYEIADKVSIYGISDYPNLEMQEDINNLQELIDKREQYRWHDLRIDPTDLPISNTNVLVYRRVDHDEYEYAIDNNTNNNRKNDVWNSDLIGYEVIAWKYIEDFKD